MSRVAVSATVGDEPQRPSKPPSQGEIQRDAQEAGLTECLIVGYDADGRLVLRSSGMARRDALWLIEQAKRHALDG